MYNTEGQHPRAGLSGALGGNATKEKEAAWIERAAQERFANQAAGQSDVPAEQLRQIPEHAEAVTREVAFQRDTITRLMQRLHPVMSLPEPQANDAKRGGTTQGQPTCELAAWLQLVAAELAQTTALLLDALQRLQT